MRQNNKFKQQAQDAKPVPVFFQIHIKLEKCLV